MQISVFFIQNRVATPLRMKQENLNPKERTNKSIFEHTLALTMFFHKGAMDLEHPVSEGIFLYYLDNSKLCPYFCGQTYF